MVQMITTKTDPIPTIICSIIDVWNEQIFEQVIVFHWRLLNIQSKSDPLGFPVDDFR